MNEALLWELFVQAGPVVNVHMPKDRVTMQHQGHFSININIRIVKLHVGSFYHSDISGYGFVEFLSEDDADYSIKIMNMIKLFGKPVKTDLTFIFRHKALPGENHNH